MRRHMKHLYFLLIVSLLVLVSCGEKPTTKQDKTPKSIPQREGIQWGAIHYGTLNEYGETDEATLLYTTADGTLDSVAFVLSYPMEPVFFPENGGGRIEEEDINFDGTPDLQICLGVWDGYGNVSYEGYVWDKEQGVFVNVPNYSNIFNPWIVDQSITSNYREWMDGVQYRTYEKYEWVDGELVKTDEWSDEFDPNEE
jgi:hypothetical protein